MQMSSVKTFISKTKDFFFVLYNSTIWTVSEIPFYSKALGQSPTVDNLRILDNLRPWTVSDNNFILKLWTVSDNLKTMRLIMDIVHVTEPTINTKQGVDLPCGHDRLSNIKHQTQCRFTMVEHQTQCRPKPCTHTRLDLMSHAYEMQICHFMLCQATCIIRDTCNIYKFPIIIFPTYNFHLSQLPC